MEKRLWVILTVGLVVSSILNTAEVKGGGFLRALTFPSSEVDKRLVDNGFESDPLNTILVLDDSKLNDREKILVGEYRIEIVNQRRAAFILGILSVFVACGVTKGCIYLYNKYLSESHNKGTEAS